MIQFLIRILSVFFTVSCIGFFLVWIQRKFSKEPQYKITYEYKILTLIQGTDNEHTTQKLATLGSEGWEVCLILGKDYYGIHILLKRETLHTS